MPALVFPPKNSILARFLTSRTLAFALALRVAASRFSAQASVLLIVCLLALTAACLGQTDQVRHLAYSTYNVQPGDATSMAANSAGEACVGGQAELYKLNSDGSLAYAKTDVGGLPAADSAGNCYFVSGGYQNNPPISVTKYDPQGNLIYTLHYPGSGMNVTAGIQIDGSGNVWLAGYTNSNDLQLVNPIQSVLKGIDNLFIAEFDSAGTLIFSTYFGGSGGDYAYALALDTTGNAYVTGYTSSTDFPLLNPLESSPLLEHNAFLTKISSTGQLLYSTYLGATVGDNGCGVATDASEDMFITGTVVQPHSNYPLIVELNPAGSAVLYSVVAPGQGWCGPVTVDGQGNAYTVGGFSLVNPIQRDETDSELVGLAPNGNVIFATYLGNQDGLSQSDGVTSFRSIGVDSAGNLYADVLESYNLPVPILNAVSGEYPYYYNCSLGFCPNYPTFVAEIALSAGASFSMPSIVNSPGTAVGSSSSTPINIYNSGTTAITISAINVSGDYSQTNNCPLSPVALASGTTCSIDIVFAPTVSGTRPGTVTIFDDSPGNPHIIQLTGAGQVPGATINPTSLNFGSEQVGGTTNPQIVTLTNSGTSTLTITRVSITGDFGETNNCTQVPPNSSCTLSVTFTPTADGQRTGTLSVADNASNSPQMVSLAGTGTGTGLPPGLGLGVAPGSSSSATVTAGKPANYTLAIGGQGVSGMATLTCTGAPAAATCSVPASENVSGTSASTFTVSVTTTARSSAMVVPPGLRLGWGWAMGIVAMSLLPSASFRRRLLVRKLRVLPFALLIVLCACGGGSGGSSNPVVSNPTGTPAGTYTLTVTATMGSSVQSLPLKLAVQ
jgi:hypothetical protein